MEVKGGIEQSATGNVGLIQIAELKNSVVFQVVNGIRTREDLDPAIAATTNHLDSLQRRKGWKDWRIPLLILVTVTFTPAMVKPSIYSIPLLIIGGSALYVGQKVHRCVTQINTEMTAANAVLVELYKQKILCQIEAES